MEDETLNYIKVTPDQLGYYDRGKLKWMGMMLSDHSEALKKLKVLDWQNEHIHIKDQQSEEKISEFLLDSYTNKKPLSIQVNIRENDHILPDIKCLVLGTKGAYIFIKLLNGDTKKLSLHHIRHVDYMDPYLWFNKTEYRKQKDWE